MSLRSWLEIGLVTLAAGALVFALWEPFGPRPGTKTVTVTDTVEIVPERLTDMIGELTEEIEDRDGLVARLTDRIRGLERRLAERIYVEPDSAARALTEADTLIGVVRIEGGEASVTTVIPTVQGDSVLHRRALATGIQVADCDPLWITPNGVHCDKRRIGRWFFGPRGRVPVFDATGDPVTPQLSGLTAALAWKPGYTSPWEVSVAIDTRGVVWLEAERMWELFR